MKILDFGLAKINVPGQAEVGASSSGEYMTTGGGALGSMPYMSPEQALGKPLDARSDLFSFGVSLYEMATGKMPFEGDTTGVLFLSIVQEASVPPIQLNPEIPDELQRIIEKCLDKDRELRYQHASDIRMQITAGMIGDGQGVAILPIAQQEFALVIGPPQLIGIPAQG